MANPTEVPRPVDPATNPYLSGRFAPVRDEVDTSALGIEGRVPDDLRGTYVRNGPNPRFPPLGSYTYPLDGDAMVHAVSFEAGTVTYRSRFVWTPGMRAEQQAGRALYPGVMAGYAPDRASLGPDPDPAYPFKSAPFINVLRHDGRWLAFDEAAPPYELTDDLRTVGLCDFGGAIPATCAHPRIDPDTGEMVLFTYYFGEPWLTWEVVGPDGSVSTPPTPVPGVDRPHMIHDCAITSDHLVLVVAPVVYDADVLLGVRPGVPIQWKPELGTRIALIARSGGGVQWVETEAFWVWHFANGFADGDEIVVDFPWIEFFFLHGVSEREPTNRVVRMRVDPARGAATFDTLDDRLTEFPRIDDRLVGKRHRYFHVAHRDTDAVVPGEWNALLQFDTETGAVTERRGEDEVFGEAVFAPRDGGTGETDGYIITFANSTKDETSSLVVLDAADIGGEPVARVTMPQRVPNGLHGNWVPAID